MLLYEVKLIHPDTKKVIFYSLEKRPVFPEEKLKKQYKDSILIIITHDSSNPSVNKNVA